MAARQPDLFEPLGKAGAYELYAIRDAKPSLAMDGRAAVRADYDRIEVSHAVPGALLIKCHFDKALKAGNGVRLEPEKRLDDPVPFIRAVVPEGVTDFTIVYENRCCQFGARARQPGH